MTMHSVNSTAGEPDENKLSLKYGVLVYLDALGAKNFSKEKNEQFLIFIKGLWDKLTRYDLCYPFSDKKNEIDFRKVEVNRPDRKIFGDTVVYAWAFEDRAKAIEILPHIIRCLVPAIRIGLENKPNKFMLRGAVSIGKYHDLPNDSSIILGPALVDAHEWHDQAEWMGIIATPTCGFKLSTIALDVGGNRRYGFIFLDYDVPVKDGKKMYLWTVSWPWAYYYNPEKGRKNFFEGFAEDEIPFEASAKYINTQKYFNDYLTYFSNKCKLETWRTLCKKESNHKERGKCL